MTDENPNNDSEPSVDPGAQETLDALNADSDMTFVATEQKKPMNKTSLVLFLIVALGGGGLYLMHIKAGPQSAGASASAAANQTINQFLSSGPNNIKLMEETLRNTEKVVQQFNNYPSVKQIPLSDLQTNPFRVTSDSQTSDDDPVAKRKLAEQRLAVVKSFQSLQLQSIMYGDKNHSCLINNTLFHEGQQVSGFTIEKITSDCIYLKQADWRFELKMQR